MLPISLLPLLAANHVLVTYYSSSTGHTKALAEAIAEGSRKVVGHDNVKVMPIASVDVEKDAIEWADAIVVGSPVHYGNVASPVLAWFETSWAKFWTDPRLDGKVGAAFATGGGLAQGAEHVLTSIVRLFHSFRIQALSPSPTRSGYNSYGAIAITGTPPYFNSTAGTIAAEFADSGRDLGALVANKVKVVELGRQKLAL